MTPENEKPAEAQKAPRHRSPNYPGISLKTAADKITGWFARDGHVAAIKDSAIKQMGGDPGRVASALKSFGLISEENGRIKLTQRGLEIAARKQDDPKRKQAMKDAALSPAIYRDLATLYASGLPSDSTLQSELITEKHFNKNYVDDFIKDFRDTLEIAGISGSTVVESTPEDISSEEESRFREGDYVQWESQGILRLPTARKVAGFSDDGEWAFLEGSDTGVPVSELIAADPTPVVDPPPVEKLKNAFKDVFKTPPPNPHYTTPPPPPINARQDVFSTTEGNVTVQWPSTLSPESYQDVSAWLDILKRKMGREVPFRIAKRDVIAKLKAGCKIDGDPESDTPCGLIDPTSTVFGSVPLIPAEMLRDLIEDGIVQENPGTGRRTFKMA
jgi:hypothetical protein